MRRFSPISFAFVAAGIATQGRMGLCRFEPARKNREGLSWDGRRQSLGTEAKSLPITDPGYWEGRYARTEICFIRQRNETDKDQDQEEKLIMNDVLVSIDRSNTIVKTALIGMDGTVKEFTGRGDYNITLTVGIVHVNDNGQLTDDYPEKGIRAFRAFFDEKKAIGVASPFFELFDIAHIVIDKISLSQETHSNRQVITITATSDRDYVLTPEY